MPRLANPDSYWNASIETIYETANRVIEHETSRCPLLLAANDALLDNLPHFSRKEIIIGRVVGRGGFCVVRELHEIRLQSKKTKSSSDKSTESSGQTAIIDDDESGHRRNTAVPFQKPTEILDQPLCVPTSLMDHGLARTMSGLDTDISSREFLARRVWGKKGGKFVIKQVEPDFLQNDRVTFLKGIIDLALEAKYLASLDHPNILKIRGVSCESPCRDTQYFLVLDYLQVTLPKRLNAWMLADRATKGITGFITRGKRRSSKLLTEKLLVAYDVAVGMAYIHSQNIIYRDLKPDNIGFDANDTLKIFDFGLSKGLIDQDKTQNGLYLLTGLTGGIRYMAPENGLGRPYNLKADVYSWSMVMWYIMALEPPMGLYTPRMIVEKVFTNGYRPATNVKWSPRLCELMRACWSDDLYSRPHFTGIIQELKMEMRALDPLLSSTLDAGSESVASLPENLLEPYQDTQQI